MAELEKLFQLLETLPTKFEDYSPLLQEAEALAQDFKHYDERRIQTIQAEWIPRMTNPELEPNPYQRAIIGRVFGRAGLG